MGRVTRVAATILLADICNRCVGMLGFDLKRSDERVFRVHRDVVDLPLKLKTNGKLHWRLLQSAS